LSTAEFFSDSIISEGKGIHLVLWTEKEELIHALIIMLCKIKYAFIPLLLDSTQDSTKRLNIQLSSKPTDFVFDPELEDIVIKRPNNLFYLFLQQATGSVFGPILNGWRSLLAEPPGTILFIRSADLTTFQRAAPDLSSFIGPKIFDTSTMLNIWSKLTAESIDKILPKNIWTILTALPGSLPSHEAIDEWLTAHPPFQG
jgi:hypothetical protein